MMRTLLVAFAVAVLATKSVSAFTTPFITANNPGALQKQRDATSLLMSPVNDNNNEEEKSSMERRKFLSQLAFGGIVGSSLMAAPNANADWLSGVPGTDAGRKRKLNGPVVKIRKDVGRVMDELQRDLMQERWDLVESYPPQLRSFVPIFTTYTDSAFPSEAPTDKGLRVALRYEVGRFFAALERLRQATARKSLNEAYVAYSDMSIHLDRYMRVGGIYTYYDEKISNEAYFAAVPDSALVYADPAKEPAEVRDLVIIRTGEDKGKTGIVIGIYPDGSKNCVVKFDRFKDMREVKIVPLDWAAKRLGEQDPDDVFLIPRKA